MLKKDKTKKVEDFRENLKKAKITLISEYQGLTVEEVSKLRRELRENGAEMKIVKNTLAKRALENTEQEILKDLMVGPLAFVLGYDTIVHAPKVAVDFEKKNEAFRIKAGFYAGEIIDLSVIKELAELPPIDQLKVKFTMALSTPPKQFLMTIQNPLNQLLLTLEGLAKKREETEN